MGKFWFVDNNLPLEYNEAVYAKIGNSHPKTEDALMNILAIYGAGGLGREVLDLARQINEVTPKWENIVLLDDSPSERSINGANIYTFSEFCERWSPEEACAVVAVGEPEFREMLAQRLADHGYTLTVLIHPTVTVGTDAEIGAGTIICHHAFVSCNTKVGCNVLVQPMASIGHDTAIGNCSVISSFVCLAGGVIVGQKSYIGIGVPVKERITIGNESVIGMGSVVLRDIPDNVRALGNPARAMKTNESKRVFD